MKLQVAVVVVAVNQLQHIPMDTGSPIMHASIADPYLITLNEDGQVMILILRESNQKFIKAKSSMTARLTVSKPVIDTVSISISSLLFFCIS